jgi:hypothetical protein
VAAATTYLTGLKCTPLDPVDADLALSAGLDTPHETLQCFVADGSGFIHLILQDLKQ